MQFCSGLNGYQLILTTNDFPALLSKRKSLTPLPKQPPPLSLSSLPHKPSRNYIQNTRERHVHIQNKHTRAHSGRHSRTTARQLQTTVNQLWSLSLSFSRSLLAHSRIFSSSLEQSHCFYKTEPLDAARAQSSEENFSSKT